MTEPISLLTKLGIYYRLDSCVGLLDSQICVLGWQKNPQSMIVYLVVEVVVMMDEVEVGDVAEGWQLG